MLPAPHSLTPSQAARLPGQSQPAQPLTARLTWTPPADRLTFSGDEPTPTDGASAEASAGPQGVPGDAVVSATGDAPPPRGVDDVDAARQPSASPKALPPSKASASQKSALWKKALTPVIQAASVALGLLSMGALFFLPGFRLLSPAGLGLAAAVLLANEGVAMLADRLKIPTLHASDWVNQHLQKPGKAFINFVDRMTPNWLFGDLKGAAKARTLQNWREANAGFVQSTVRTLDRTPMFTDITKDLRAQKTWRGKLGILARSLTGLLPTMLLSRFMPGRMGMVLQTILYNLFGFEVMKDPTPPAPGAGTPSAGTKPPAATPKRLPPASPPKA